MKIHPGIARLRAFAADETRDVRLRSHLAECRACRDTVAFMREVRQQLRDDSRHSASPGAWNEIARRVAAGEAVLLPAHDAAPPNRLARPAVAAAAVLVVAGGVAAVAPGSPLRAWLERADRGRATEHVTPVTGLGARAVTELLVPVTHDALTVMLERPARGLRVRVRVTDGAELRIEASGAAAGAVFRSGTAELTITDPGAGELALAVPRTAVVRLMADGTLWAETEGGELRVHAPVVDTIGADVLILVPER